MITLKLASYSEEERDALQQLFESASEKLEERWCGRTGCKLCQYRHLCRDLRATADFAAEYSKGGRGYE